MENTGIVWPAFLPNQILMGNPKSNVAIICGWTKRDLMKKRLEEIDPLIMDRIAGIGQLYTAERGVDVLIRNLLANPRIDTVLFCGRDISRASIGALAFLQNMDPLRQGFTASGQKYTSDHNDRVRIWGDVPVEAIDSVRARTNWVYNVDEHCRTDAACIVETVKEYDRGGPIDIHEPQIFPPPRPDVDIFPAPNSVQVLRAKTVADGWLELLHYIMTYGKRVPTHYDQDTMEIVDLVMVITAQPPHPTEEETPHFLPFSYEHLVKYQKELLSSDKKSDVSYTYGNLMRAHFGQDQVVRVMKKLAKDRGTRSAVISLWDANSPMKGSPCLNHIWFRILEGKLNMTATIRSNDMFQAWPENAYGLRALQEHVRCGVLKYEGEFQDTDSLALGDLVIVSQSAHIYEDCWGPAKELVEKHRRYREWWDEKGQWVFEDTTPGRCKAILLAPSGETLQEFEGTPTTIRAKIAKKGLISDIGHALYVGQMLGQTPSGREGGRK